MSSVGLLALTTTFTFSDWRLSRASKATINGVHRNNDAYEKISGVALESRRE
jgi:hypothetical protein